MGLLAVPRALGPQAADDLGERRHLAGDRRGEGRDVDGREVVGLDRPVELVPGHLDDALVGQAEALEHDDGGLGARVGGVTRVDDVADGQLDRRTARRGRRTGRRAAGPAPPPPRSAKRWPSTRRTPSLDRVDAEAHPRQVEERQRRHQLDRHPSSATQQLDRVLGHDRRAGHGVQHLAVLGGRRHQRLDDAGVDVVDARRPRRRGRRSSSPRPRRGADGWRRGAQEAVGDAVDRRRAPPA